MSSNEIKKEDNVQLKHTAGGAKAKRTWINPSKKIMLVIILIIVFFCVAESISNNTTQTAIKPLANLQQINEKIIAINPLAIKLNLNDKDISIINKSVSNNGITMSVVSSYVAKNTAVVLLTFTKDNGIAFGNHLNPDIKEWEIEEGDRRFSVYSDLSTDKKTLYAYITCHSEKELGGKTVKLGVEQLICSDSQVEGKVYPDLLLEGKWHLDFSLKENTDKLITGVNLNLFDIISMCGKELQINYFQIVGMQVIINTTTLSEKKVPIDISSNISPSSGAYYDVFVTVFYTDGSKSEKMDCYLDKSNNIIANSFDTLTVKKVKEVHIKDVVIPVN